MKRSIKAAIWSIAVFAVMPLLSMIIERNSAMAEIARIRQPADSLAGRNIRILVIEGKKATPGMLSVAPTLYGKNEVSLNVEPGDVRVDNDSLFITLTDAGDVYQGRIRLKGLEKVYFNDETRQFVDSVKNIR